MAYKRLGDVLIDAGLITEDQLGHALKQQKETKRRLGDELIAEGVITEAGLIEALQMQLGVEFVDLSAIDLDPELSRVISKNVARQYNVGARAHFRPTEVCPGHERSTELHGHRSGEERHSEARHPYGDHA